MIQENVGEVIQRLADETGMGTEIVKTLYMATGIEQFVISSCKAIKESDHRITAEMMVHLWNTKASETKIPVDQKMYDLYVEAGINPLLLEVTKEDKIRAIGEKREKSRTHFRQFARNMSRRRK